MLTIKNIKEGINDNLKERIHDGGNKILEEYMCMILLCLIWRNNYPVFNNFTRLLATLRLFSLKVRNEWTSDKSFTY